MNENETKEKQEVSDFLAINVMKWNLVKGGPSIYSNGKATDRFPDEWHGKNGIFVRYYRDWIPYFNMNQAMDCLRVVADEVKKELGKELTCNFIFNCEGSPLIDVEIGHQGSWADGKWRNPAYAVCLAIKDFMKKT